MRPLKKGVPKVVITITDGKSNNEESTKLQAAALKQREVNLISIGIGSAQLSELNDLSSRPSDQYFVEDFTKVMEIITDITRTNCRMPSEIRENVNVETTVKKDTYKYFHYPIPLAAEEKDTYMRELTIELEEFSGSSDLFFSFDEENPKSDDEFLTIDEDSDEGVNFIDGPVMVEPVSVRSTLKEEQISCEAKPSEPKKTKFFQVTNLNNTPNLYVSVKGLQSRNAIKVNVHKGTARLDNGQMKKSMPWLMVIFGALATVFIQY